MGCETVVSFGRIAELHEKSSIPASEMRAGHSNPMSKMASSAPSIIRLFAAKMAVGGSVMLRSRCVASYAVSI